MADPNTRSPDPNHPGTPRSHSAPPGGDRRTPDWQGGLLRLKESLVAARPADGDRYRHGMLWVEGDPADAAAVTPRILAGGGRVRRAIPVACPAGGHLVHYFFDDGWGDDGGTGLDVLARVVRRAPSVLAAVPQRALPRFALPPVADGRDEGLLLWAALLHWLGRVDGNSAFRSTPEALPAGSELSTWAAFADWDRFPVLPGFDPVPLMTGAVGAAKTLDEWRAEHQAAGRPLPEVIAASLSKPLWYASANAVDQILLLDRAAPPRAAARDRTRPGKAQLDATDRRHVVKHGIVLALCEHHRPAENHPQYKAVTQKWIAGRIGVTQPTVSRGLGDLMREIPGTSGKSPRDAYRDLCKGEQIHGHLLRLRIKYTDPQLRRLFTRDNLDRLADTLDGSPEDEGADGAED